MSCYRCDKCDRIINGDETPAERIGEMDLYCPLCVERIMDEYDNGLRGDFLFNGRSFSEFVGYPPGGQAK